MTRRTVLLILPLVLAACGEKKAGPLGAASSSSTTAAAPLDKPQALEGIKSGPLSFAPIAKAADPSVVTIQTTGEEAEPSGFFGGRTRHRETKGLGTGFVIDKEGT
ncbi:MAG: hypothetical protein ABI461_02005, partial [Polyangiaceae bacterium]